MDKKEIEFVLKKGKDIILNLKINGIQFDLDNKTFL